MVDQQYTTYQGVQLETSEATLLHQIEEIIGEPVSPGGIGFYKSGFIHPNQHILDLAFIKKTKDPL